MPYLTMLQKVRKTFLELSLYPHQRWQLMGSILRAIHDLIFVKILFSGFVWNPADKPTNKQMHAPAKLWIMAMWGIFAPCNWTNPVLHRNVPTLSSHQGRESQFWNTRGKGAPAGH